MKITQYINYLLVCYLFVFLPFELNAQITRDHFLRLNNLSNTNSMNSISSPLAGSMVCTQNNFYSRDTNQWRGIWSDYGNNNIDNTGFIGTTNNSDIRIRTYNTQRMVIKNDGKVGVKTDNPDGIFQVSGEFNLSTNHITTDITATTNSGSGAPNVIDDDNSTFWQSDFENLFEYSYWVTLDLGTPKIVQRYRLETTSENPTSWHFQGSNNNSTWTTIHSINGSLETSWTTRDYTLTSQITAYRYYRVLMTRTLWLEMSPGVFTDISRMRLAEFKVYESTQGVEFIVATNGNVGINNDNPTQRLHVIGNILASGSITPDYVFESYYDGESHLNPTYKLQPLNEVEQFIKENKHLPGVPSAQDIEEQGGILVNKATEINLEKIEELYIYLFELIDENERIKKSIKRIEKEVLDLAK